MSSPDSAAPIPVTILAGFPGAGKTTLLNRILNGDHGLRVAVLVNDFGAINIDAGLLVGLGVKSDLISLANGCVYCPDARRALAPFGSLDSLAKQHSVPLISREGVRNRARSRCCR